MKIKVGWIITAVCLIAIARTLVPRLTYWMSAPPSAAEPARQTQATPQATIETMLQMMEEPSLPGSLTPPLPPRFNQFHLLDGKEMTPEEQTFAHLIWDTKRSGVLFAFMTEADTGDPHVTDQQRMVIPQRSACL